MINPVERIRRIIIILRLRFWGLGSVRVYSNRGLSVPLVVVFYFLFTFFAVEAKATLLVHWDCNLPNNRIDCFNLKRDFLASIPVLQEVSSANEADLSIDINTTVERGRASEVYAIAFKGQDTLPVFTITEAVPNSMAQGLAYNLVFRQ